MPFAECHYLSLTQCCAELSCLCRRTYRTSCSIFESEREQEREKEKQFKKIKGHTATFTDKLEICTPGKQQCPRRVAARWNNVLMKLFSTEIPKSLFSLISSAQGVSLFVELGRRTS